MFFLAFVFILFSIMLRLHVAAFNAIYVCVLTSALFYGHQEFLERWNFKIK